MKILTVSELTNQIKSLLESEFDNITLIGEISNFKAHVSGHWYFVVKDDKAQISCTMWKGLNSSVTFKVKDGDKVEVTGKVTVYPPRGNYQLDVRKLEKAGIGELQQEFEKLKNKLFEEGLFDEANKKPIPVLPKTIGVITAKGGAAIEDMISVANRRFPLVELLFYPSKVQGEGAAEEKAEGIKFLNTLHDIDLIIIGRGGGSLEDLWAFNEVIVARAIYNSDKPIISGIGHEIDFTIADFVADFRAATPTAAMEHATPDIKDFFAKIEEFSYNFNYELNGILISSKDKLNSLLKNYSFRRPVEIHRLNSQRIDFVWSEIQNSIENKFRDTKNKIEFYSKIVELNNVSKTLQRGFALIKQNGKFVKKSVELIPDKTFNIEFSDKEITVNHD